MALHRLDKFLGVFLILLFVVGLILVLLPAVCMLLFDRQNSEATVAYASFAEDTSNAQQLADMRVAAQNYNNSLLEYEQLTNSSGIQGINTSAFPGLTQEVYRDTLSVDSAGAMGVLYIPRIKVEIPIYHGTSTQALSHGVGHLEGTSLPIGGVGSHSVLTGHSGLVTQRMFTDLEQLQKADRFFVRVGAETLEYEVNQIRVIDPYDVSSLAIDPSHDFVTLMTCTPYGLNTERLVVRGVRIAETPDNVADASDEVSLPTIDSPWKSTWGIIIIAVVMVGCFVGILLLLGRFQSRHRIAKLKNECNYHI